MSQLTCLKHILLNRSIGLGTSSGNLLVSLLKTSDLTKINEKFNADCTYCIMF